MSITVRATQRGYYGHQLREKGDTFTITDKQEMGKWMETVTASSARAKQDETPTLPPSKGKRVSDESKI